VAGRRRDAQAAISPARATTAPNRNVREYSDDVGSSPTSTSITWMPDTMPMNSTCWLMPLAMPMSFSSTAPATMAELAGPMKPAATPESTRPTTMSDSAPPPELPANANMDATISTAPARIGRRSPQRLAM
jgi:hypothetical protein